MSLSLFLSLSIRCVGFQIFNNLYNIVWRFASSSKQKQTVALILKYEKDQKNIKIENMRIVKWPPMSSVFVMFLQPRVIFSARRPKVLCTGFWCPDPNKIILKLHKKH